MVMHEITLTTLNMPFRESDTLRKRRLEGGRNGAVSLATMPLQRLWTGTRRFGRSALQEGPDAMNGRDKLEAMPINATETNVRRILYWFSADIMCLRSVIFSQITL